MAQHTIRPIDLTDLSGGLRCDVPSHDIAPNQLYDIQNFDVDSPGRLLSRKGYKRVSDVGIALAPVRGVYEHIERGGRKHVIAACNGRLWRLNERNRTWSEIYRESATVTSWGDNLLSNGTFDANTTGWTLTNGGTNTTIARDTTNPYAGAGCLKIVTTTPPELAVDGGMETWTTSTNLTSWVEGLASGTINRHTTRHSGSYSAYRTTYSYQDAYLMSSDFIDLNKLDTYRTSVWIRSSTSENWFIYRVHCYQGGYFLTLCDPISLKGVNVISTWENKIGYIGPDDYVGDVDHGKIQLWYYQTHNDYMYWIDDVSFKARPRFNDSALSPVAAIVPANRRLINLRIKRASTGDYTNMHLKVYAKYYTVGDALISTVELLEPTTITTYTGVGIQQAANVAPPTATKMKLYFEATGFYDAYDATAAGHGWYIDEVEIKEVDDSGTVIVPLVVNEKVNPTFVSFMGNCYIFGYDKNIKLVNAKAIEFLPSYPQSAHFCIAHLNRLFLTGDSEYPSRLYFTGLTAGGQVNPDVIDPFDFIDFDPDDGDRITGIAPCGAGIVVFKRRGTFMLTGSNEADWFVRKVSSAIGCASHRSIARYQGSVIFLDDNNPGVFMFDGSTNFTMLSRHIDPLIARIVYRDKATAMIQNERYYLFCDDEDAVHPYNESVYVYSLKIGSWTKYAGIYAESVCKGETNLLAGSPADDGLVFRLFDGYEDDGEDIESYIITGDNQFRKPGVESRVRKVTVIADSGTDDQEIDISYASDRAYLMRDAASMSLAAIGKNKWGVGLWGGFDYDAAFNVLNYGATDEGVGDDTDAIQEAIDALP